MTVPKPEYDGNSLVNLVSSIAGLFDKETSYPPLKSFPDYGNDEIRNVVLIIIDGLGYNTLKRKYRDSFLAENTEIKITSVYPPTTAAALTSIYTGKAPLNHGIPAWFVYFKELGFISSMPPMLMRGTNFRWGRKRSDLAKILGVNPLVNEIDERSYFLVSRGIYNTPYSNYFGGKSQQIMINSFDDLLEFTKNICVDIPGKKLIFGYWHVYDQIAHNYGMGSGEADEEFGKIDASISEFIEKNSRSLHKTLWIITADHGFVDVSEENHNYIWDHPDLRKTMAIPLCGEPRAPFFYVRPSRVEKFKKYIEEHFGGLGTLYTADELINTGLLGSGDPHPSIFDRIGDFVYVLEEKAVFRDKVVDENFKKIVGYHGGLTEDEMYVPLFIRYFP